MGTPAHHAVNSQFLHTPDFKRYFIHFVHNETLLNLMQTSKAWSHVADETISSNVKNGTMMVHDGKGKTEMRGETEKNLVTRVIFLQIVTQVGDGACLYAINLVNIDIPEGITSIGEAAFANCERLATVTFPTSLTSIGAGAFDACSSLVSVDLLHTSLQKIDGFAFSGCSELKSVKLPPTLQTLGEDVFLECTNLVPSNFIQNDSSAVVAYLRSNQRS